ncbi:hypothetical protein [Micromonospora sp. LOL_021]|uniref:hypothetical protein n=1 Tax=Micromonospora sp. LOL_021 TaxID=3345417 RepID=UPI003A897D01
MPVIGDQLAVRLCGRLAGLAGCVQLRTPSARLLASRGRVVRLRQWPVTARDREII